MKSTTRPAATEARSRNPRRVIEFALDVMVGIGRIDEVDDELVAKLSRLYDTEPLCQVESCDASETLAAGEHLVRAWERDCRECWQRAAPRWDCPCGVTFALADCCGRLGPFHTIASDGLLAEAVQHCPRCGRNLARVRAEHGDGQLGFPF